MKEEPGVLAKPLIDRGVAVHIDCGGSRHDF